MKYEYIQYTYSVGVEPEGALDERILGDLLGTHIDGELSGRVQSREFGEVPGRLRHLHDALVREQARHRCAQRVRLLAHQREARGE